MMAMPASDTVYTFSFTTDWFHTVKAVAPISVETVAVMRLIAGPMPERSATRRDTRNHTAAATALEIAASTLMRMATLGAIGRIEKNRPTMTNSGLPGGCGMPKVYAAAMYSLASHIA